MAGDGGQHLADTTDISAARRSPTRAVEGTPAADVDGESLERLVRETRPRVFRWALVRTGDADQAEDVAQEVAIRIVRRPPSVAGDSLAAWLYRVTANVANDLRRKRRRWRSAEDDEIVALPDATRNALDALVGAEAAALLSDFMSSLSTRQREVLQLVDVDGFSAVEAAEVMGIDAATARVHLLRARRAMRSRLLEEEEER